MPASIPQHVLKGLARNVIAEHGLHVSTLAGTLRPPINAKTLAAVLRNGQRLSANQETAVLGFLSAHVGVDSTTLRDFHRQPRAQRHRELLCRAVGVSLSIATTESRDSFFNRKSSLESAARSVVLFDAGLPDELCYPPPHDRERLGRQQVAGFVLLSSIAPHARSARPFGFGNQDDKDEIIENLIDQVEHGRVSLNIINDLTPSWTPSLLGSLAPFQSVELLNDRRVLLLARGDSLAVTLVDAGENPESMLVVDSVRHAVEQLRGHLAHDPQTGAVVQLLERMLSPTSWRTGLHRWRNGNDC